MFYVNAKFSVFWKHRKHPKLSLDFGKKKKKRYSISLDAKPLEKAF